MTISEAAAVNTLLRLIIGRAPDAYSNQEAPSGEEALRAAELLAAKANKTLMAGWRPERVRELWPKHRGDVGGASNKTKRKVVAREQDRHG